MTISTGQRRHHFKNTAPRDPVITPFSAWPIPNRSFQHSFYQWLKLGGYGPSTLNTYSVAARLALGYLNKLHWTIDPETDIASCAAISNNAMPANRPGVNTIKD